MVEAYKSLNDAAKISKAFLPGKVKVWYMVLEFARDGMMGYRFLKAENLLPNPNEPEKTHVLLGEIKGGEYDGDKVNLNATFGFLQGEMWSPEGEARELIRSKGLSHTSMSVGDMLEIDGKFFMVDMFGFKELL